MRILLDENMPHKLLAALTAEGHEDELVEQFLWAFRETDWLGHKSGADWPGRERET